MANSNASRGLRPVRHVGGGKIRLSDHYSIASAYGTAIYQGDPVQMTGTAKNIELSAATNVDNIGVFWGVSYVDASGNQVFSKYWPASTTATDIKAYVYDDPNIEFEVQADTATSGVVGRLIDWAAGTGSATTGQSGAYANSTTTATTGAALRIMGLVERPDNAYGQYAKIRVMFAEHVLGRVIAGVGGI